MVKTINVHVFGRLSSGKHMQEANISYYLISLDIIFISCFKVFMYFVYLCCLKAEVSSASLQLEQPFNFCTES